MKLVLLGLFSQLLLCAYVSAASQTYVMLDMDNTLGSYVLYDDIDTVKQLRASGQFVIENTWRVNSHAHPKEFNYYAGQLEKIKKGETVKKKVKLQRINDTTIEAFQYFALRPEIFRFLEKLKRTIGPNLHYLITSRGLDERVKNTLDRIPFTVKGRHFDKNVRWISREKFRVEKLINGKKSGAKSVEKLLKSLGLPSDTKVVIIDDCPKEQLELRGPDLDLFINVPKLKPSKLRNANFMESEKSYFQQVRQEIRVFINQKK